MRAEGEREAMRALLALTLLLAPPTAAACDWLQPATGSYLLWAGEETALTNEAHAWGLLRLRDQAFSPVANVSSMPGLRGAASGDGAWMAYVDARGVDASCSLNSPRVEVVRLATGERMRLLDAEPGAMAATTGLLALSMRGAIHLHPWGDREAARTLEVPWLARALAFSHDGRLLASANETQVAVHDLDAGERRRLEAPGATRIRALAFSPGGAHLAALDGDGVERRVLVWDLGGEKETPVAARGNLIYGTGLSWGPAGVAVVGQDQVGGTFESWALVLVEAPDLRPAWEQRFGEARLGETTLPTAEGDGFWLSVDNTVRRLMPGEPLSWGPEELPPAGTTPDGAPPAKEPPATREVPAASALGAVLVAAVVAAGWRGARGGR